MHQRKKTGNLKYLLLWIKEVNVLSLTHYTIQQLETMLQKKDISAEELANLSLDQIKAVDEDVKAFLTVTEESAIEKAKQLDEQQSFDKKLSAIPGEIGRAHV